MKSVHFPLVKCVRRFSEDRMALFNVNKLIHTIHNTAVGYLFAPRIRRYPFAFLMDVNGPAHDRRPQYPSRTMRSLFDCALPLDPVPRRARFLSTRPSYLHPRRTSFARDITPTARRGLQQFRSLSVIPHLDRELITWSELIGNANASLLDERMLQDDPTLLPELLDALRGVLQRLYIDCTAPDFSGQTFVDVFAPEVSSVSKLIIYLLDEKFPFTRILWSGPAVKRLHLVLFEEDPPRLQFIRDHAPQLTELVLHGVDNFSPVHCILKRLPSLEHFTVEIADVFQDSFPADKIFEGVSHQDSRLRSLDMDGHAALPCPPVCGFETLPGHLFT